MTLKKAMENCGGCYNLHTGKDIIIDERDGAQIYASQITNIKLYTQHLIEANAKKVSINSEGKGSLHYRLKEACINCDKNIPMVLNLGPEYIREQI